MTDTNQNKWDTAKVTTALRLLRQAREVIVAIPVYNGGADTVSRCIESVVRHSDGAKILVIDDASTDPTVVEALNLFAASGDVELIRHDVNWGYTRTANHAFEMTSPADVVMLNSDTVVGAAWLRRLRWVAYSQDNVGTVSAISDNAGAMSVPKSGTANEWPQHLTWTEIGRGVGQMVKIASLDTPTAHGFCMYVKRILINIVGGFDEDAFPQGYGEENDFSRRGLKAGFTNLLAPHVLVGHARSQSFGAERRTALIAAGRIAVDARHPDYTSAIRSWASSNEMHEMRQELGLARNTLSGKIKVKPCVMYVIHRAGGGTPATNKDLLSQLVESQDSILLESDGSKVRLYKFQAGKFHELTSWAPESPFAVTDTWHEPYAAFVARILINYDVELIHIRHLINQPLTTVSDVAEFLSIPVILSTHDFYYICPTVHLLDDNMSFCGGKCTPGEGLCTLPTPFVAAVSDLKHNWISVWKKRSAQVLGASRHVIATTPSAGGIYARNYPEFVDKIRLIEHGRDVSKIGLLRKSGKRIPGPLRIMVPANWSPQKGTDLLLKLMSLTSLEVEWHVFGKSGDKYFENNAVIHGEYTRENFETLLNEIDPDFIGIFSIWAETYSHTVTEGWAMGIPLIATDIGAPADRIREHGGGLIVPLDAYQAAREILDLARNQVKQSLLRTSVPRHSIRSDTTMGQDYAALYSETVSNVHKSKPTIGYIVHGGVSVGSHPASVHIRTLRRIESAQALGLALFKRVVLNDLIAGTDKTRFDALYVQRNAIPHHQMDDFLATVRLLNIRLVVDLDDDLVTLAHGENERSISEIDSIDSMALTKLVGASAQLTLSTRELNLRLSHLSESTALVENRLDPRIWDSYVPEVSPTDSSQTIRAVYFGTVTHAEDLALLEEVFANGLVVSGKRVLLDIVGVSRESKQWFTRIKPPSSEYTSFVRFLRSNQNRWDLALAPLVDDYFNRGKSDLKLLEYKALGLPVVASNVGPYHAHPLADRLTDNSSKAWKAAISDLIRNGLSSNPTTGTNAVPGRVLDEEHVRSWVSTLVGTR